MFNDPKNLLTYHINDRTIRVNGTPVHLVNIRKPIEYNSRELGERRIVKVLGAAPVPGVDALLSRVLHGEEHVKDAIQLISRYRATLDGNYTRTLMTYGFDEAGECFNLMYDVDNADRHHSPYIISHHSDDMVLGSLNHGLTTLCNDLLVTAANGEAGLQALIKIATHRMTVHGQELAKKLEHGLDLLERGGDAPMMYSVICEAIDAAWPVKSAIDNTIPRFMLAQTFARLHEIFNNEQ